MSSHLIFMQHFVWNVEIAHGILVQVQVIQAGEDKRDSSDNVAPCSPIQIVPFLSGPTSSVYKPASVCHIILFWQVFRDWVNSFWFHVSFSLFGWTRFDSDMCHFDLKANDTAWLNFLPSGKLTQLWKITILKWKTHYKWPCSIAFCMLTRG